MVRCLFCSPHVYLLGVRAGCDAESGASAADMEPNRRWASRAEKTYLRLAAAQSPSALACSVLGRVRGRTGMRGGRRLGTVSCARGSGWEVICAWQLLAAWLGLLGPAVPGWGLALRAAPLPFPFLCIAFLHFPAS